MYKIVIAYILLKAISVSAHGFSYDAKAQMNWYKDHRSCGGAIQSPIMIKSSEAIPIGIPALETIRYRNIFHVPLTLVNNGHTVALSVNKNGSCDEEIPYIFGGPLFNEYVFETLHFHWGFRNNRGSEHILDDILYPLEMHLVHRNKKYKTVSEALEYRDGLAVLGIFFQLSDKPNKRLNKLLNNFQHIIKHQQTVSIDQPFTLSSLLPHEIDNFYTYKGSLTTPPCSEAVTWIVFTSPLHISMNQMNMFRRLLNENGELLVDNYRFIQNIRNRKIFARNPTMHHELNALRKYWFHNVYNTETNEL